MDWYFIPINPEPWAVGQAYASRSKGKLTARISRNVQLDQFQQAVKEELLIREPKLIEGYVRVVLYLWRQNAQYQRIQTNHYRQRSRPDTTNMQKAIEDACQGILYTNDRYVNDIHSVLVQAQPDITGHIVIGVEANDRIPRAWMDMPPEAVAVMAAGMESAKVKPPPVDADWAGDHDSPF